MTSLPSFTSILFPTGYHTDVGQLTAPDCFTDLHLDQVVDAVTAGYEITAGDDADHLRKFFYAPLSDTATIDYRHDVFRDLNDDPTGPKPGGVLHALRTFADGMREVKQRRHHATHLYHPLQRQAWLAEAADAYCTAVATLRDDLAVVDPSSRGVREFAAYVGDYAAGAPFRKLTAEATNVLEQLKSVRYAVHIDGLQVHVRRYADEPDYSAVVIDTFERFVTAAAKDYHVKLDEFVDMNDVEERIVDRVAKLFPDVFARLDDFCARHAEFVDPVIARFDDELRFYLSYLAFTAGLTNAGLAFSYPEITTEPGTVRLDAAFDVALAIRLTSDQTPVVCNDFRLADEQRIFVVTGPNQGGKTTVARTVGQCAYLAALGCPVPAGRSALTLPDRVYTHFERQETLSTLHGKLDDELVRIHDVLSRATAASVVIMNESFASTTVDDALLIGGEVLGRIIELGCVTVYVTFLDELAGLGPSCVSMVGEVARHDPTRRTFRFTRRPADGFAYAAALADKYRLGHDVLLGRIRRGAMAGDTTGRGAVGGSAVGGRSK